jgi:predicted metal-dependent hydrolase
MGDWFVRSRVLDEAGGDPVMIDLIRWHASEEVEHRNVAFDVYQAASGNYVRRVVIGAFITLALYIAFPVINAQLMRKDKSTTKRFSLRYLAQAGRRGVIPDVLWALGTFRRDYLRRDYHPSKFGDYDAAIAYLHTSPGVVRKAS